MRQKDVHIEIANELDVVRAVMAAGNFAESYGFSEAPKCMVATTVSELAGNILRYAGSGYVRIRSTETEGRAGVEIVAHDHGNGIADLAAALEDHHSTGGTLGLGLPGVRRMMDEFHVESERGKGTRVTARKWL